MKEGSKVSNSNAFSYPGIAITAAVTRFKDADHFEGDRISLLDESHITSGMEQTRDDDIVRTQRSSDARLSVDLMGV